MKKVVLIAAILTLTLQAFKTVAVIFPFTSNNVQSTNNENTVNRKKVFTPVIIKVQNK